MLNNLSSVVFFSIFALKIAGVWGFLLNMDIFKIYEK